MESRYDADFFKYREKLLTNPPVFIPVPIIRGTVSNLSNSDELQIHVHRNNEVSRRIRKKNSYGLRVDICLLPLDHFWRDRNIIEYSVFPCLTRRLQDIYSIDDPFNIVDIYNCSRWGEDENHINMSYEGDKDLSNGMPRLTYIITSSMDFLRSERLALFSEHVRRIEAYRAIRDFVGKAQEFRDLLYTYETHKAELSSIYRSCVRNAVNGELDLSKVAHNVEKFLKREAITREHIGIPNIVYAKELSEICSKLVNNDVRGKMRDGIEFERLVGSTLERMHYKVDYTATTGDFGADIIGEKDELRFAIQCKAHAKPAGVKAVQEAAASRRYYKCDFAVVVSLSGFTSAAQELGIELGVLMVTEASLDRLDTMIP
jgi:hypothetical protein